jgi:hypothetical protein
MPTVTDPQYDQPTPPQPTTPPPAPYYPPPPQPYHAGYPAPGFAPAPTNGLATASLVIGIVGFVVTLIPFFVGLLLGGMLNILAFIFGIIGVVTANRLRGVGQGSAIAGIVLSCVAFALMFVGAGTIW